MKMYRICVGNPDHRHDMVIIQTAKDDEAIRVAYEKVKDLLGFTFTDFGQRYGDFTFDREDPTIPEKFISLPGVVKTEDYITSYDKAHIQHFEYRDAYFLSKQINKDGTAYYWFEERYGLINALCAVLNIIDPELDMSVPEKDPAPIMWLPGASIGNSFFH